ncbi:hypothetical protein FJ641_08335 [Clostridium perfringens]|nr:hypothetical protein [Clostridium perfringens]
MSEHCEHSHFECCCGKDCDTCPYSLRVVKEYRITNPSSMSKREKLIQQKVDQMINEAEHALFPIRLRWGIDKKEDIVNRMEIAHIARKTPEEVKHIILILFSNGGVSYRFA